MRLSENSLSKRVDEEDARRLEIPEIAIRHLAVEHACADERVDPLVAPEREHEDLQRREDDDRPRDGAEPNVGIANVEPWHNVHCGWQRGGR